MKKAFLILFHFNSFVIYSKDSTKLYFSPYIDFGHLLNLSYHAGTFIETNKLPLQIGIGFIGTAGNFNQNNERNKNDFDSKYYEHKPDKIRGLGYHFSLRYVGDKSKGLNFVQAIGVQQSFLKIRVYENMFIENGPIIVHRLSENSGKINQNKLFYQFGFQTQKKLFLELMAGVTYSFIKIDENINELRDYNTRIWDFGHDELGMNFSVKLGYRIYKNKKVI